MVLESPGRCEDLIVDERRVARCVEALVDDHARQDGHLTLDDFQRVVDRRRLSADEILEAYRRLQDDHSIAVERAESPPGRHASRGSSSGDALSLLLAAIGQYRLLTADDEVRLARRIRSGEAAARQLLTQPNSSALAEMISDGVAARAHMILANMRLVVNCAVRYQRVSKLELPDLIQEGVFGLTRAVEKFDHTLGYKFSTYATWWIRQSIQRAVLNRGRTIRLPVHVHEELRTMARSRTVLSAELGRTPTAREVADHAVMDHAQVQFLLDIEADATSLDQPLGDPRDLTLGDSVPADCEDPSEAAVLADTAARVAEVIKALPARERQIIAMRFGFAPYDEHTLEEVGRNLGVTRERVRQLQNKLLEDVLPALAKEKGLDDD